MSLAFMTVPANPEKHEYVTGSLILNYLGVCPASLLSRTHTKARHTHIISRVSLESLYTLYPQGGGFRTFSE